MSAWRSHRLALLMIQNVKSVLVDQPLIVTASSRFVVGGVLFS